MQVCSENESELRNLLEVADVPLSFAPKILAALEEEGSVQEGSAVRMLVARTHRPGQ